MKRCETTAKDPAPPIEPGATAEGAAGGPVDPRTLDLGYLALFVGMRINELVLDQLHAAGFEGLRQAHGYVFQHLLVRPLGITELAQLLGVSQQAASKSVAELLALGFLQEASGDDRRVRAITLSERGLACVRKARSLRAAMERRLVRRHGAEVARTRHLLAEILSELGGVSAVRTRTVRAPR